MNEIFSRLPQIAAASSNVPSSTHQRMMQLHFFFLLPTHTLEQRTPFKNLGDLDLLILRVVALQHISLVYVATGDDVCSRHEGEFSVAVGQNTRLHLLDGRIDGRMGFTVYFAVSNLLE